MQSKLLRVLILVPVAFILTIGMAIALDQTNGSGVTNNGASLGFNAKGDLSGNITYTSHDGTGFQVMCRDGLTKVHQSAAIAEGVSQVPHHRQLHRPERRPHLRGDLLRRSRRTGYPRRGPHLLHLRRDLRS